MPHPLVLIAFLTTFGSGYRTFFFIFCLLENRSVTNDLIVSYIRKNSLRT